VCVCVGRARGELVGVGRVISRGARAGRSGLVGLAVSVSFVVGSSRRVVLATMFAPRGFGGERSLSLSAGVRNASAFGDAHLVGTRLSRGLPDMRPNERSCGGLSQHARRQLRDVCSRAWPAGCDAANWGARAAN
jgi:hypothetical protein